MPDNRLYLNDAADLVESPEALAALSKYTTRDRCAIGEQILRRLEKSGAPAPPRIRRYLDESGQSNRCRGRASLTESAPRAPVTTAKTWTEGNVAEAGADPAARAQIRAMSPFARRNLAENLNSVSRGAARRPTETVAPVAQAAVARSRMAPAEARTALWREAEGMRLRGVAGSFASSFVMACQQRPDIAEDAGYTEADVTQTIRNWLTPTPYTGQLGRGDN